MFMGFLYSLAEKMKKEIVISKDSPGFIINRVLMPYINEAVFVLSEGVATKENIDKGTKIGLNRNFYWILTIFPIILS